MGESGPALVRHAGVYYSRHDYAGFWRRVLVDLIDFRVVSIQGERPGIWPLTIRAVFALMGPLAMLFDVIWSTGDEHRQALHDKFAHTYVIRRRASPVGQGAIVYATYTILGGAFLFAEVRPATGDAARQAAAR